jgi:hypothetical protein
MSGGTGKKELSANDIIAKKNFELLCAANFKDFLYRSFSILKVLL